MSTATHPSAPATPKRSSAAPARSSDVTAVYMVDDHPVICKAVANALDDTLGVELYGYATSFEEAHSQIEVDEPDVVIVDVSLPDTHGLDLTKAIKSLNSNVAVLVFSMYDETVYAERALRAGASGYVMKTAPVSRLVEAIRRIERGETYLSPRMSNRIVRRMAQTGSAEACFSIDELTERELEIFRMLGHGYSVDAIQDELDLSRKTVETHRRRAREKLDLDSISELLQYALQWTFVEPNGVDGKR